MKDDIYQEIKEKWQKRKNKNLQEAMDIYFKKNPMLDNNKDFYEILENQRNNTEEANNLYAEELKKEYNLTDEEWFNKILAQEVKDLLESKDFKEALERLSSRLSSKENKKKWWHYIFKF